MSLLAAWTGQKCKWV